MDELSPEEIVAVTVPAPEIPPPLSTIVAIPSSPVNAVPASGKNCQEKYER